MLKRNCLTVGALVALAMGAVACDQGITNLNKNPNSPEDVPAGPLFTNSTRQGVARWLGTAYSLRGTEFVTQHLAEAQYPDEDRYNRLTGASTTTWFTGPYTAELQDYRKVIAKGQAAGQAGVYAPAMIMQVWGFSYLTDTWGDIPYSEALLGDSVGAPIFPKYDTQQDIYNSFFSTLDASSKALSGASAALGSADPIYQGNPAKWQKFSNSLRARLALRVVNQDKAKASAELTAAFAAPGGLIETNADNAQLKWPGDGVYNNPWSVNLETRDDHRMSNSLMDILNATNDPRLPIFALPTEDNPALYLGMPNGLAGAEPKEYLTKASRIGKIFQPVKASHGTFNGTGANLPAYVMTAAEVLFIKAEAAERGLGGLGAGQAKGFYESAIRASMAQWGVTNATAIDAFLAKPDVAYKGGTEGLKQIGIQRWIALFTDGGNAWAEWRRTCLPATVKPGPAAIASSVPRRFQYATAEYTANKEQLTAAIGRQGADEFSTRMWWDKNPTAAPTYVAGCGSR